MLATGHPSVSDVYLGLVLQRPVVSIEVPVPRPRGGPELVLSMHPGANSLDQVIRRQQPAPGWIVAVIDRAGVRAFIAETLTK